MARATYGARADLARVYGHARFKGREYAALRAEVLVNVGRTGDEKQIEMILKEARSSPDNEVLAAAGEVLGNFTEVPVTTRREIVKELLIIYGGIDTRSRNPHVVRGGFPQDFSKQNAEETLQAIQARWNRTLSVLTGRDFGEYAQWSEWLRDNPRWEPPGGDGG